ncbi:MAG: oligosaccharide flippase family protein [Chitinophagales bacterium]
MRRKFAGNLLILILANVLIKPLWIFGIDRVVQNRLGAEVYGTYFALFNYSFLFSVFLDFGINNFNNRAIARHHNRLPTYFSNLLGLKFVLGVIYFLITAISAWLTGFSWMQLEMLAALGLNQFLLTYILYIRSNLTAIHRFKADAALSVSDRLLSILFCGWLLLFGARPFSIHYFIFAQTAALTLTLVLGLLLLQRGVRFEWHIWRYRYFKAILQKSFPFALVGLLMTIYYRIDGVMLERLYNARETGIYAQSYRLLDAINQFGYLAAVPLLPLFAGMIKRRDNLRPLLGLSASGMFVFSFGSALLCWLFSDDILHLLYKEQSPNSEAIFRWLMLSFIPISSVYVFGTLLTANGSLGLLNGIAALGILINVSLNFVLIPGYGALGATMATLFTQMVVAGLHIYVCVKVFKLFPERAALMRVGWFTIISVGLALVARLAVNNWLMALPLAGLGIVAAVFISRMVTITAVKSYFQNRREA